MNVPLLEVWHYNFLLFISRHKALNIKIMNWTLDHWRYVAASPLLKKNGLHACSSKLYQKVYKPTIQFPFKKNCFKLNKRLLSARTFGKRAISETEELQ